MFLFTHICNNCCLVGFVYHCHLLYKCALLDVILFNMQILIKWRMSWRSYIVHWNLFSPRFVETFLHGLKHLMEKSDCPCM